MLRSATLIRLRSGLRRGQRRMSDYRRSYVAGGTFFFTLVTASRSTWLCDDDARETLRQAIVDCRAVRPFEIDAAVLLPDHLHMIWTLPRGDTDYSSRWAAIKREVTARRLNAGRADAKVSPAAVRQRRRGFWQRRFWEHTIADEIDMERHVDYIHFNPVKHGYCHAPKDWPHSSFHRFVRRGHYPLDWGRQHANVPTFNFSDISNSVYE